MKNTMIMLAKPALCMLLLLTSFTVCQAQKQHKDFSGKWLRNEEKTDYGSLSKAYFGQSDMEIVKGESFYLVKLDSVASHDTKLSFDGSETGSLVSGVGGDRKKTTTMKWVDDSSFIDSSIYSGGLNYSSTKKYNLSDDGKQLTIIMHIDYKPLNSIYDVKLVYDKQ